MKVKLIYYAIIGILISCSVNSETDTVDPYISARIKKITIDHVIKYRDWCRFSYIEFDLELKNLSKDSLMILGQTSFSPCDDIITKTNHKISLKDSVLINKLLTLDENNTNLNLSIINLKRDTFLLPNQFINIKSRIGTPIFGGSINDILISYQEIFENDFEIESLGLIKDRDTKIVFAKSKKLNYVLKLDDNIIEEDDTASMNKSNLIPPPQPKD